MENTPNSPSLEDIFKANAHRIVSRLVVGQIPILSNSLNPSLRILNLSSEGKKRFVIAIRRDFDATAYDIVCELPMDNTFTITYNSGSIISISYGIIEIYFR